MLLFPGYRVAYKTKDDANCLGIVRTVDRENGKLIIDNLYTDEIDVLNVNFNEIDNL